MKLELVLLLSLLLCACSKTKSSGSVNNKIGIDTIVASKMLPQEITGTLYRGKEYFVIMGNDTSYFSCIFLEHTKTGRTSIKFECDMYNKKYLSLISDSIVITEMDFEYKIPYYKTTYKQQISELKMILKKSTEDFDLDKLQYMSFELLSTGDLAIEVTNQYIKEIGAKVINNYKSVGQIFLNSQLGIDLNLILKPYFISIEQVSIEKLHFITRNKLYKISRIETDLVQTPDKILNCSVYVKLKRF
jgi:hypothetical protein